MDYPVMNGMIGTCLNRRIIYSGQIFEIMDWNQKRTNLIRVYFASLLVMGIIGIPGGFSIWVEAQPQNNISNRLADQLKNRLQTQDTDNDGIADIVERARGTDPDDPQSKVNSRLSAWSFNHPEFVSDSSHKPGRVSGVFHRLGFSGPSLAFNPDAANPHFNIPHSAGDGTINCASHNGTVFFYFRPDWNSGEGPGDIAPLLSVGLWTANASYGYWGLTITPDGRSIFLGSHHNNQSSKIFEAPLNWKKDQWYLLRFTWGPAFTALYIDGVRVAASGPKGIPLSPDPQLLKKDGVDILGDRYGQTLARGSIDELEIYNYGMGLNNVKARYSNLISASYHKAENFIKLDFPSLPGKPVKVYRRQVANQDWTLLKESLEAGALIDREISQNTLYEYKVESNYPNNYLNYLDRQIIVSTGTRTREPQGILAVVVDQTIQNDISLALKEMVRNWIEDGWQVRIIPAPRHNDDGAPGGNHRNVVELKNNLASLYEDEDPQERLSCIVLIGHVAVPYSGRINPDGHFFRAWEADLFYGDLVDGQKWTDRERDTPGAQGARVPDDGILDPHRFPSSIEVPVGRIDFANLPAFSQSEPVLISNYLEKVVRYKNGTLTFPPTTACFSSFPHEGLTYAAFMNQVRNASPITGNNLDRIFEVNIFKKRDPFLLGVQLGAGSYDTISNGNASHIFRSSDIAANANAHRAAFLILDGSYFGNWNTRNNFLRSVLTVENGGLASLWGRQGLVKIHWLNTGMTMGECVVNYANYLTQFGSRGNQANVYIQLMGDPTLTATRELPPTNFTIKRGANSTSFSWDDPENSPVYLEYTPDGIHGKFEVLTPTPLRNNPLILDRDVGPGITFRLRRVVENDTPSGYWIVLSHGALATSGE